MVYSQKYDYYKFPGGGKEIDEDDQATLLREVLEETGYEVLPDSIKPFGKVNCRCRYDKTIFDQANFYYLAKVKQQPVQTVCLNDYEQEEGFTPGWIQPQIAINVNCLNLHGLKSESMIDRDARVLQILI